MWYGFSGGNMWWSEARDFPDTCNNAYKPVEPLVQGK